MLVHLEKSSDFKGLIEKGLVVVDFFATWCGPCKALGPELEDLALDHKEVTIVKVDVDQFGELAAQFRVNAVPTLVYFKDGKQTDISMGYMDKDTVYKHLTK